MISLLLPFLVFVILNYSIYYILLFFASYPFGCYYPHTPLVIITFYYFRHAQRVLGLVSLIVLIVFDDECGDMRLVGLVLNVCCEGGEKD